MTDFMSPANIPNDAINIFLQILLLNLRTDILTPQRFMIYYGGWKVKLMHALCYLEAETGTVPQ